MNPDGIAFPTSGDPEEDARIRAQYILHTERMEDNVCPNGCATMTRIDDHNRECPVCHFQGYQNTPLPPETPEPPPKKRINLLLTPKRWGPITDEQVAEHKPQIFECGICSNEETVVYHNLLGRHNHRPAAELLPLIPPETPEP